MKRLEIGRGAILGLLCQILGVIALVVAPGNTPLALAAFIFIPVGLVFVATRSILVSLVIASVSDMFAGGSGTWAMAGAVSGRWILVLVVLVAISLNQGAKLSKSATRKPLLLFGIFLPLGLLARAAFAEGIVVTKGIGDVAFLWYLLYYFPLRFVIRRHSGLFLGWVVAQSIALVTLLLLMSVGPAAYRQELVAGMIGEVRYGDTLSGISRVMPVQVILAVFPFFLGFFTLLLTELNPAGSLLVWGISLYSLAPLALLYLRGPMLGVAFAIVVFVISGAVVWNAGMLLKTVVGTLMVAVSVAAAIVIFVPDEGAAAFSLSNRDTTLDWLGASRLYQAQAMMEKLDESPWLGAGVGTPLSGYEGKVTTEFELQYLMLLYRFGWIFFAVLLAGIAWILVEPWRAWRGKLRKPTRFVDVWASSCLASTIAILVAGAFNPYLRAPFGPVLFALYLALKDLRRPVAARRLIISDVTRT